jgi:Predicted xylanase/chitin deacetylase
MNILMYHFVSSEKDYQLFSGMNSIKVETFEKQIIKLKKKGTPLSSDDINTAVLNRDYPGDDFFYLTFDDGFKQPFYKRYIQ